MENVLYSIWPGYLHESNRDVYVDLFVTDELTLEKWTMEISRESVEYR